MHNGESIPSVRMPPGTEVELVETEPNRKPGASEIGSEDSNPLRYSERSLHASLMVPEI